MDCSTQMSIASLRDSVKSLTHEVLALVEAQEHANELKEAELKLLCRKENCNGG